MSFINITALKRGEYELKLYGVIGADADVSFKKFETEFNAALKAGMKKLVVNIASGGGSVYEGIAIYNLIKSSKIKTVGIVNGIAASMASIILLACDERKAHKFSKIMTHQPSIGTGGNAKEMREKADRLESYTKDFKAIMIESTGQSETVVNDWLADDKDKWFTAEEALALNIITEIIDGDTKAYNGGDSDVSAMVAFYTNQFNKSKVKMDEILNELGLSAGTAEKDVIAAIVKLKTENQGLKDAQINAALESGKKAGVVNDKNEAHFKALFSKDYESTKAIIDSSADSIKTNETPANAKPAAPTARVTDMLEALLKNDPEAKAKSERDAWSFADWTKKDPEGLKAMLKNEPEKYKKLKR